MPLAFTHGRAAWSYAGFYTFRRRLLLQVAGVDLSTMEGFAHQAGVPARNAKRWSDLPAAEPLLALINHSDCNGDLSPEQCAAIAPRLRTVIASWPEADYDRQNATLLASGMELAASKGERLRFAAY